MEGKGRSRRQSLDGFDVEAGTDSSEDNGRSHGIEGYGGLTKFGGSHIHICVCSIVDQRAMITASNIAYHDCQICWRHDLLHVSGAHDVSPHQFSLKASQTRRFESGCERRFESRVEESFDRAVFSSTCESTTGSDAGDGGVGARRVPAGRPVAQRCGPRHILDQDLNDNNENNNNEHQRHNDEDNHKDDELISVEMV